MLTIFNRKELTITYSMEQQAKIRDLLAVHKIDYRIKVVSRDGSSGSRTRAGTLGQSMATIYEYIIFVRRKDYGIAQAIIAGNYLK